MTRLIRLFMSAIFVLAVLLVASDANAQVFSFKWGSSGSGDGQFNEPVAIAIDSSANVYISDQDNNRIQKFDINGNFLKAWGSGGTGDGEFRAPRGIGIDSSNNIYVADSWNNRVQKFDSDGNYLAQWGSLGANDGEFNTPYGIAIDSGDFVYVADFFNDRVQRFGSDGTFSTKWGSTGSGDGQFKMPRFIAVDSLDNIYVSDANNRVQKFDTFGTFLSSWGTGGIDNGQFHDPMGIAIDSSGNIFVSEWGNNRVQEFDGSGAFITKWGIFGLEDGQFRSAAGVAVQPTDRVYVVDSDKNQIQVFTPPLPPAGDGTGIWRYSMTNNRIIDQGGVVCTPEADQSGIASVYQTGQYIKILTSDGNEFTGFVSGSDVNASTTYYESGGFSAGELIFTLSSTTTGAGILRYSWTDNVGSFCTGEADLSMTKLTSDGGGGGCFIGAAFNGLNLRK